MDFQLLLSSFIYKQLSFYDNFVWKVWGSCVFLSLQSVSSISFLSFLLLICFSSYLLSPPDASIPPDVYLILQKLQNQLLITHIVLFLAWHSARWLSFMFCAICVTVPYLWQKTWVQQVLKLLPLNTGMIDDPLYLSRLHTVTYKMCISNLCYFDYHGF